MGVYPSFCFWAILWPLLMSERVLPLWVMGAII
nr:MAG TPA: hypothetical protein [Caudoviricetes sp.]